MNSSRHPMESEQRAPLRFLESVSQEREAQHLREKYHLSEQAALLSKEDGEEFTFS